MENTTHTHCPKCKSHNIKNGLRLNIIDRIFSLNPNVFVGYWRNEDLYLCKNCRFYGPMEQDAIKSRKIIKNKKTRIKKGKKA